MCERRNQKKGATTDASIFKLGPEVTPSHYQVQMEPDLGTKLFKGNVEIDINVRTALSSFQTHANGLKITNAWVVDGNGTRLDAIKTPGKLTWFEQVIDPTTGSSSFVPYTFEFESAASFNEDAEPSDPNYQRATFNFAGQLGAGKWRFFAEFEGSMVQPSLEGLYVSDYEDDDGQKHWMASTQFEATHARRSFPCFDEPALKATYDITLVVDEHLTALSNGRTLKTRLKVKKVSHVDGKKVVEFKTSPKMSTYLVAYCVGEFESSDPIFVNGKEIRIWTVKGKKHLTDYALQCAAFGVKTLEKLLRVPYFGGDKIDLIAIPNFRSGAMENTSLITFRATALLVDAVTGTTAEMKRVAEVVFHELVHQWFGNLVTMIWWDGLPLNESNATILAYFIMDLWEKGWNIFNDFGIDRAGAFALDSLNSTHACWAPVGHPDEVEERFDQITYEKGGSVEYQMAMYIGLQRFWDGMHIYLTRFAYGNAEVTDLWDALEEGAREGGLDVPVREIMDAWFLNVGHPVVTVTESKKPGFVKLHQERFRFLAEGKDEQLWPIPLHIRYATADGEVREEKFIFSDREQEVFIDKGFQYVIVNAGGPGFYRVRYSQELLSRLTEKPFENLQVIERFNLVNDSWALVRAQLLSSDTYLGLVKQLAGEKDPNVWNIVAGSLLSLHSLTDEAHRPAFKALIRELVKPVFDELGWTPKEGESAATLELRGQMAALLGTVGEDAEVQAQALTLFASWKKDRSAVDPNVVPALVSTLAYTGDKARFDEFVSLAKAAPTDQEKLRFLNALGKFRTPELYKAAIEMMLASVKTDDAPFILAAYMQTEHAGEATWNFIRSNWKQMVDKFPGSGVVRMIGGCSALDKPELKAQVEEFFSKNKVKQGDMAVAQMIERLTVNVRLREMETPKVHAYLKPSAPADGGKGSATPVAAASDKK